MEQFQRFELEWEMAQWDRMETFNLSESGITPLTLQELIGNDDESLQKFLDIPLDYAGQRGSLALRETLSDMYSGATQENILPVSGAAEANYLVLNTFLNAGDQIVMTWPNYPQIWGIAKNLQLNIVKVNHMRDRNWALYIQMMDEVVTENTKLIAICNPDNPTGYVLTRKEREAIINAAQKVDAWILADEVYAGSEITNDTETKSLFGEYDKVITINSLSKTYAIPGLRLGWIVAPHMVTSEILKRKQYTTITTSTLSDRLAAHFLQERNRQKILARTRTVIRKGAEVLEIWIKNSEGHFSVVMPQASGIAFVRYNHDINSSEFMKQLYQASGVSLLAGDFFGIDGYLRISFGRPEKYVQKGLEKVTEFALQYNR